MGYSGGNSPLVSVWGVKLAHRRPEIVSGHFLSFDQRPIANHRHTATPPPKQLAQHTKALGVSYTEKGSEWSPGGLCL